MESFVPHQPHLPLLDLSSTMAASPAMQTSQGGQMLDEALTVPKHQQQQEQQKLLGARDIEGEEEEPFASLAPAYANEVIDAHQEDAHDGMHQWHSPAPNTSSSSSSSSVPEQVVDDDDEDDDVIDEEANQHYTQGKLLFDEGDFAQAVTFFSLALELEPSHLNSLCLRGIAYAKLDQPEEADDDLTAAIDATKKPVAPPSYRLYFHRAESLRKLGRYEASINDYTFAMKLMDSVTRDATTRADKYSCLIYRSYLNLRLGRMQKALDDANLILEGMRGEAEAKAYTFRAFVYEQMGRLDWAEQDRALALKLSSGELPPTQTSPASSQPQKRQRQLYETLPSSSSSSSSASSSSSSSLTSTPAPAAAVSSTPTTSSTVDLEGEGLELLLAAMPEGQTRSEQTGRQQESAGDSGKKRKHSVEEGPSQSQDCSVTESAQSSLDDGARAKRPSVEAAADTADTPTD